MPAPIMAMVTTTAVPAARHGFPRRPPAGVVVTSDERTIGPPTTHQHDPAQRGSAEQARPAGGQTPVGTGADATVTTVDTAVRQHDELALAAGALELVA